MKQVVTKFGCLKVDNGRDTVITSDTICYLATYSKLMKLSKPELKKKFLQRSFVTVTKVVLIVL